MLPQNTGTMGHRGRAGQTVAPVLRLEHVSSHPVDTFGPRFGQPASAAARDPDDSDLACQRLAAHLRSDQPARTGNNQLLRHRFVFLIPTLDPR